MVVPPYYCPGIVPKRAGDTSIYVSTRMQRITHIILMASRRKTNRKNRTSLESEFNSLCKKQTPVTLGAKIEEHELNFINKTVDSIVRKLEDDGKQRDLQMFEDVRAGMLTLVDLLERHTRHGHKVFDLFKTSIQRLQLSRPRSIREEESEITPEIPFEEEPDEQETLVTTNDDFLDMNRDDGPVRRPREASGDDPEEDDFIDINQDDGPARRPREARGDDQEEGDFLDEGFIREVDGERRHTKRGQDRRREVFSVSDDEDDGDIDEANTQRLIAHGKKHGLDWGRIPAGIVQKGRDFFSKVRESVRALHDKSKKGYTRFDPSDDI